MKNFKKWISSILVFALLATNSLSHVQFSYANELVNNEESVGTKLGEPEEEESIEATADNVESKFGEPEDVEANMHGALEEDEEESIEATADNVDPKLGEPEEETEESNEEAIESNEESVGANMHGALDEIVEDLNIASISNADEFEVEKIVNVATISELLESIYADYIDVLSYTDGTVSLIKDINLNAPLNIKSDLIFDLNNHILNGPNDGPALNVENANLVITDSKSNGLIKGNSEVAVINIINSKVEFVSGTIIGADAKVFRSETFGEDVIDLETGEVTAAEIIDYLDGATAIYALDSNLYFNGSKVYGGTGKNYKGRQGANGGNAVVVDWTKDEYVVEVNGGCVKGGMGGTGSKNETEGMGGYVLLINDVSREVKYGNLSKINGANGDFGSGNGGHALVVNGEINESNIKINNGIYLYGGDGGVDRSVFGSGVYDNSSSNFADKYTTDDSILTSLKNQYTTGLCWDFTHMALAETYMLKFYNDYCQENLYSKTGEFDLSEVATAYFAKNPPADPLGNAGPAYEYWDKDEEGEYYDQGGNGYIVNNYATQFRGFHKEELAEFPTKNPGLAKNGFSNPIGTFDFDSIAQDTVCHLTDYEFLELSESASDRTEMVNFIKQKVVDKGACGIGCFYSTNVFNKYTGTNQNTMCVRPGSEIFAGNAGGHAILVIGWDDNFDKDNFVSQALYEDYKKDEERNYYNKFIPQLMAAYGGMRTEEQCRQELAEILQNMAIPGNGAFLTKNSHGCYTWISYYQTFDNFTIYTGDFIPTNEKDNMYYYDAGLYSNTASGSTKIIQKFVAKKEQERVKAVSFSVASAVENVTFKIYKVDFSKDAELGTNASQYSLLASADDSPVVEFTKDLHRGTNYIEFDKKIPLKEGDIFIVMVESSNLMYVMIDKNDDSRTNKYATTLVSNKWYYHAANMGGTKLYLGKEYFTNDESMPRLRLVTETYERETNHIIDKNWFSEEKSGLKKYGDGGSKVTKITIQIGGTVDNINKSWDIDDDGLKGYVVNDTEVVIYAPEGDTIATGEDASYLFSEFAYATGLYGLKNIDTSRATTMAHMFFNFSHDIARGKAAVVEDLETLDVSNVKDMTWMLAYANNIVDGTLDLSK